MRLYCPAAPQPHSGPVWRLASPAVLVLLTALILLASSAAWAIPKGNARIAVDAHTGEVLVARGSLTRWHPASLTKMMTLYLLFEAMEQGKVKLNDRIAISHRAARQPPSRLGIGAGGSIAVRDAIQILAVKSANDISVAVAEHLAGTEVKFAQRMNAKAKRLGMRRTNFRNASGLHHSQQVTTARDMAVLAVALMRDFPQYYKHFSQKQFRYGQRTYTNTNRMLGVYKGMDGLKTGYIYKAGFNLAASARHGDRRVIAVVMGANSSAQRTRIMQSVLDQAFDRLKQSRRQRITAALPVQLLAPPPVPRSRPGAKVIVAQVTSPPPPSVITAVANPPPMPPERVVADAPVPMPAPAAWLSRHTTAAAAPRSGRYSVQIGAYRSKGEAQRHLVTVISRLPQQLGAPDPLVAHYQQRKGRTLYRARLVGYNSRDDAARTCNWLKNQQTDCLIVASVR